MERATIVSCLNPKVSPCYCVHATPRIWNKGEEVVKCGKIYQMGCQEGKGVKSIIYSYFNYNYYLLQDGSMFSWIGLCSIQPNNLIISWSTSSLLHGAPMISTYYLLLHCAIHSNAHPWWPSSEFLLLLSMTTWRWLYVGDAGISGLVQSVWDCFSWHHHHLTNVFHTDP